jgi:hypothetical protein
MINPVVLNETGHSYEAANISRWLDMHSKCPLTGQRLHSKQLSTNRALQNIIADWAAAHGIVLPAAPTYTPVLTVIDPSTATAPAAASTQAAATPSVPHTVLSMPHLEDRPLAVGNSITRESQFVQQQQQQQQQPADSDSLGRLGKDPALPGGNLAALLSSGHGSKMGMLHCSRTRWTVALLALVVVLGVVIGVVVGVSTRAVKGRSPTGCVAPCDDMWHQAKSATPLLCTSKLTLLMQPLYY